MEVGITGVCSFVQQTAVGSVVVWQLQQKPPYETSGMTVTLNSLWIYVILTLRGTKSIQTKYILNCMHTETQYTKNMD